MHEFFKESYMDLKVDELFNLDNIEKLNDERMARLGIRVGVPSADEMLRKFVETGSIPTSPSAYQHVPTDQL